MLNLGFRLSPRVLLHTDFSYTAGEAGFDSVIYDPVSAAARAALVDTGKYDYDHSRINDLSDLDVQTYGYTLGGVFDLSEAVALSADLSYQKWDDREWYVADGTGDFYYGSLGLTFKF